MKSSILFLILFIVAFLIGYTLISFNVNSSGELGLVSSRFNNTTNMAEAKPTLYTLSDKRAISPTLSKDGNAITYYEKNSGRVFRINLKNKEETILSDKPLPDFIGAQWSLSKNKVLSSFSKNSKIAHTIYDYSDNSSLFLRQEVKIPVFSPDGKKIAYSEDTNGENNIIIFSYDIDLFKNIFKSRASIISLAWPNNNFLTLKIAAGENRFVLYKLSLTGDINKLTETESDPKELWAPDGSKFVYNNSGVLYLESLNFQKKSLNIYSSPEKCGWSNDNILLICAGQRIVEFDKPELSSISESFYSINTKNGQIDLLYEDPRAIKVGFGMLSDVNNTFVFVNALDSMLYALELP